MSNSRVRFTYIEVSSMTSIGILPGQKLISARASCPLLRYYCNSNSLDDVPVVSVVFRLGKSSAFSLRIDPQAQGEE